ncbi:MAG: aromatic hydrocarbon degradation protein [Spirochaetes bacterium]|nr:MAG: aromatic hydrocarbon degradation protein [Spirochaetota bacterium]
MRNKGALLLAAAAFVFFSSDVFATNGMRMIGFGPVQRSMGGASVGIGLDAASILTNPAGMSDLGGRIDFGASYFAPSVEYKAVGAGPGMVANDGETFESDRGASPVPAFGLIIPATDQVNFGIGAYGIAGMGVDYAMNLYSNVTYSSYSQMRFAPGASYKINDMISVGAVLNLMYATMEYYAGPPEGSPGGQRAHMGASAFGYGATVGVKVTPVKMLTLGVAYESKSMFQDFVFNTGAGVDKLEFNQPSSATVGLGIMPIEGLVIGFDLQWIRWSETNGKNQPKYTENSSAASAWNLNWDDQLVYKFGIQYVVIPMLTVRAGYNYGKMPLDSTRAFENIAFPAIAEQHFTAGVGIGVGEKFTLNIGGMYSPEASLKGANAAGQGITSYETKMSQYSLDVGLAYKF